MLMKKGSGQKYYSVRDDQKFLEGINLITGDKIDYSKHLLSESQINAMCVSQKMTRIQKFIHILIQGEKIQKWSILENMPYYIQNSEEAQKIFSIIEKNYNDYDHFILILGEGISSYLKACVKNMKLINKKIYDMIFRLIYRTITSVKYQGSEVLLDWMIALKTFLEIPQNQEVVTAKETRVNDIKQYINGSFALNTLPQRRKTAFEIINATLQLSQDIYKQAHNKILFFNNDLNPSTRLIICNIIEKMLIMNPNDPEIWKCVLQYYSIDKSFSIKQKAFSILTTIYYPQHSEIIFNSLQAEQKEMFSIIISNIIKIIKHYDKQIKKDNSCQTKIISFLNRLLKINPEEHIPLVIQCFYTLTCHLPQNYLLKELQFKTLNLQKIIILSELINLYHYVFDVEYKQSLKRQIMKGIRFNEFNLKINHGIFLKMLDMIQINIQEDVNVFIFIFGNQLEHSKWKNIQLCLDFIKKIKLHQGQYDKVTQLVLKLYSNSPYYMIDQVNQVILELMLADKKNMQIYQKIKERYISSRCWTHRRNYIKLYAFIKMNASFQFNKFISTYVYKNILSQRNILLKQEFIKEITKAYSFIDPNQQQEKIAIKEVINRLSQQKDFELCLLAQRSLQEIKEIDKDYELIHYRLLNNREIFKRQMDTEPIQPQVKKHIKTEKLIGKDFKDNKEFKEAKEGKELRESKEITSRQIKSKKISIGETKTTLNLMKISALQKNKIGLNESKPNLLRSSSNTQKKDVKLTLPSLNPKKSRF